MNEKKLNVYYIGNEPLWDHELLNKSTIEDCYEYLKDKKVISIDIETTGLDEHTTKIVMFQIGDTERQYVIDYRRVDISILKDILIDPSIIKVGQNIKFEYKHILHKLGVRINNLYDTMVVEQILYNGLELRNGLADLNERYLNVIVDKSIRLEFLTIEDKEFTARQIMYGAEDVLYPLLIRDLQLQEAKRSGQEKVIALEMLFVEVLGEMEHRGINFNRQLWLDNYNVNLIKFKAQEIVLNNFILINLPDSKFIEKQLDLFSTDIKVKMKWTSSKQVIKLFRHLGICPKEVSKSTNKLSYTVNAKVVQSSLNTFNKDIPDYIKEFIQDYLKFKELEQTCTTFGIKFLDNINPVTKRIHSNYKQILNTGRISSSGPNLQNIPAEFGFRRPFDAPPGYKIINSDYSGQENICLANASLDKDILAFYEQGLDDMHKNNCA